MCRQDGRGRFPVFWTITPNVGQTHKENPNLVRILYMVCTLNDIYKQYNKLHEHWYTKISSLRCFEDRNPPQNASDLYMKYWSYAEHCRPCTRLSGVNWWKKKKKKKNTNCSYRIFIVCRSPVSPVFWARMLLSYLFYLCTNRVRALISRKRGNWWYPLVITSIGIDGTPLVPVMSMSGTSGIYYV